MSVKHLLLSLAFVVLTVLSTYSQTTYYYVGGDGATVDFTTGTAWSTSLGGAPVGGTITPSATTNYVVDGSDVSNAGGAQLGTSITLNLAATRTIGQFSILNNSITVAVTGVNFDLVANGDVTVNTGCTLNNQTEISTAGNLINNGTLTYATNSGEFTFTGTAKTISGSSTTAFRKFTIAAGATISLQRNIEITGNLVSFVNGTLNAQTYLITEGSPATTASVTLAATGLLQTSNPAGVRGIAGATIDPALTINMNTGNTIEFNAPGGIQDVWCGNGTAYYHNVILSGGGTKRLVNGSATFIDIRGSLTIATGTVLDPSATQDATNIKNIQVDVNLTNNGSFMHRTSKVTMNGPSAVTISMNGDSLYDFELANATTDGTALASNIFIVHNIIFTNGRLLLGNNNLTIGSTGGYTGTPTTLKMLVTNGNGELRKVIPAGGQQFTYYIGDNTGVAEYSPVTLNFTANSIERTVGCRVVDAQHPNDGTATSYISRYWHFSTTPAGGTYTYNATFNFNSSTDLVGAYQPMTASYIYLPNTTWLAVTSTPSASLLSVSGATETTASLNNAEVTARVTAGCTPPAQPGAFTVSSATVCSGQSGVVYTVPNDPNVTYTWTYSGANTTINGSGNSVTLNFGANATSGTLSVTATNICTSAPRTIDITVTPTVGTPSFTAGATTLCAGGTDTYTATATNSTGIAYSIVGGVGATINPTTGVVSNVTGNFTVRATATGTCGGPTTADRVVTVTPTVGTPSFTAGATTLCAGGTSTYTATATNSTGIAYSIVGGVGATINPTTGVVSNVTGNFTVRATATGTCGGPTTADRVVTVTNSLTISQQPQSVTPCFQGDATFTVTAAGSNLQYQWFFNGNPVGTNSASYTVTGATVANNGNYSVSITSDCGSATSNIVTLNVLPVLFVFNSATICEGETYTFQGNEYSVDGMYYDTLISSQGCDSIEALDLTVISLNPIATVTNNVNLSTGTFASYQWLFNGNPIANAISQNYTATQNGSYSVVVTNGACSDTSNSIVITTIGINELLASVTIFPNPTTGNVFIKNNTVSLGKLTYMLTDVTGRKLVQNVITSSTEMADLTGYAPGVYLLMISNSAGENTVLKIVKE